MTKKQTTSRRRRQPQRASENATHQEVANAIALLLDNEMSISTQLYYALTNEMLVILPRVANITAGHVARRIYPVLCKVAEEEAACFNMNLAQWIQQEEDSMAGEINTGMITP